MSCCTNIEKIISDDKQRWAHKYRNGWSIYQYPDGLVNYDISYDEAFRFVYGD